MMFVLEKRERNNGFWPRLTKESRKTQYIQIDWEKWVDEDEEAEEADKGMSGFDPEAMNNFNDSDDEEEDKGKIDDLEEEAPLEKESLRP